MAYKPRITEKTLTLKGATVAAGSYVLWRATVPCRVVAVRAYRVGGTDTPFNATKNGVNMLTANGTTPAASTWASGTLAAPASVRLAEGDTLAAVVGALGGTPTDIIVQIDIRKDAAY
ncbi:hypothetical protein [Nonomuraea basaltis]|uniref:hypothetical protein n=1 Tax=Nonomuraea basaltis TaxID=2495887 RepID=UPI00110C4024|nr:hypothetical protein [Nonomuraea basaltis]TMR97541.1 hypothetical protein EJK15_17630 [Nonomuraea basaltis]